MKTARSKSLYRAIEGGKRTALFESFELRICGFAHPPAKAARRQYSTLKFRTDQAPASGLLEMQEFLLDTTSDSRNARRCVKGPNACLLTESCRLLNHRRVLLPYHLESDLLCIRKQFVLSFTVVSFVPDSFSHVAMKILLWTTEIPLIWTVSWFDAF